MFVLRVKSLKGRLRCGEPLTILETTAGHGTAIGYRFEHLRAILDAVETPDRIAFCADTCHLFAAGYPIHTPEGWNSTVDEFDAIVGLRRLAVVHVNDSKKPLGSRVDRHDHIGRGQIGLEANEGIALSAWPDEEALARGAAALHAVFAGALESRAERLVATLRPPHPTPPARSGVYAFRFFEILDADWTEFADLSARAWPGFEGSYDARICGFFRSLDVQPPDARVLLLTRYASLAVWEASRADVGREEFQRGQKLTRTTIVCSAVPG